MKCNDSHPSKKVNGPSVQLSLYLFNIVFKIALINLFSKEKRKPFKRICNTVLAYVQSWLGLYFADFGNFSDHFFQFENLAGFSKQHMNLLSLIKCTCAWVLWIERKTMIFNNEKNSIPRLLNKTKLLSFWWLNAKFPSVTFVCGLAFLFVWSLVNPYFSSCFLPWFYVL